MRDLRSGSRGLAGRPPIGRSDPFGIVPRSQKK
jgi:hypothetical protein